MKVRSKNLSEESRIQTLDALYTAAGTVRGRAAMKVFLRDLLTESERIMLGRRILIARKLIGGETYDEIATELSVGNTTIRKVDRWLQDEFPGYEAAVHAMEGEFKNRSKKPKLNGIDRYLYATSALYRLKKKYPLHFLLFPLPKRK
jgi:uncharacterized protein YerC